MCLLHSEIEDADFSSLDESDVPSEDPQQI